VVLAALKVVGAAALIDQRLTFDSISWTAKVCIIGRRKYWHSDRL
jgi:hypothetical protein